MASITSMERGKLCPMSSSSASSAYFRLQCWQDGRNCTRYVPAQEVESVRQALANHERFQTLAKEFVDITVAMTHAEDSSDAKKNATKSKPSASRKRKPSSDSSESV